MARNDQEEALDKILTANLARAIDFIKFAEAKNAAVITFSSAWIIGLINILSSGKQLPRGLSAGLKLILPLLVLAALISLYSFVPRLSLQKILSKLKQENELPHKPQDRNLLFFGDISNLEYNEFREAIERRYLPREGNSLAFRYVSDISAQIYANSKIAQRKFEAFNIAVNVIMFSLVVLLVVTGLVAIFG